MQEFCPQTQRTVAFLRRFTLRLWVGLCFLRVSFQESALSCTSPVSPVSPLLLFPQLRRQKRVLTWFSFYRICEFYWESQNLVCSPAQLLGNGLGQGIWPCHMAAVGCRNLCFFMYVSLSIMPLCSFSCRWWFLLWLLLESCCVLFILPPKLWISSHP